MKYISNNTKIVGLFISDLAKEKEITQISVTNNELGILALDVIKKIPKISCFTLLDDDNLF